MAKKGGGINNDNNDEDNKHNDDKDHNNTDKVDVRGGALRWAAVGGGKSNAVGCLPGSGGWADPNNYIF